MLNFNSRNETLNKLVNRLVLVQTGNINTYGLNFQPTIEEIRAISWLEYNSGGYKLAGITRLSLNGVWYDFNIQSYQGDNGAMWYNIMVDVYSLRG